MRRRNFFSVVVGEQKAGAVPKQRRAARPLLHLRGRAGVQGQSHFHTSLDDAPRGPAWSQENPSLLLDALPCFRDAQSAQSSAYPSFFSPPCREPFGTRPSRDAPFPPWSPDRLLARFRLTAQQMRTVVQHARPLALHGRRQKCVTRPFGRDAGACPALPCGLRDPTRDLSRSLMQPCAMVRPSSGALCHLSMLSLDAGPTGATYHFSETEHSMTRVGV